MLIATDVAGQGLNLQHRARWVINLELPWNPVRLEQRAGRVDRIGQRRSVHITSIVARHGAETGLLTRLARRVLAARRALDGETLPIAPPAAIAEPEIAGALLFGQPLPEPAVPQAPLCTRWRRHGRWLARTVTRRRGLAAAWRGPVPGVTPATLADITRLPSLARLAPCWLVFVVPIVDDAGAILESRVIAVAACASDVAVDPARCRDRRCRRASGLARRGRPGASSRPRAEFRGEDRDRRSSAPSKRRPPPARRAPRSSPACSIGVPSAAPASLPNAGRPRAPRPRDGSRTSINRHAFVRATPALVALLRRR